MTVAHASCLSVHRHSFAVTEEVFPKVIVHLTALFNSCLSILAIV